MLSTRLSRVLLVVGLVYASLTLQRLALWSQGEAALWEDAAQQSQSPRPWVNLGNLYRDAGREEDAELAYLSAIRLADAHRSPDEWMVGGALAQANLGGMYLSADVCADMDYRFVKVARLFPLLYDSTEMRCNRGRLLVAQAHDRWPQSHEIAARFEGTR